MDEFSFMKFLEIEYSHYESVILTDFPVSYVMYKSSISPIVYDEKIREEKKIYI